MPLRVPETSLRRPPVFETGADRQNGNLRIASIRRSITVPTTVNAASEFLAPSFHIGKSHRDGKFYEENVSMLIGHGVNQLEQRITNALCSGSLPLQESDFLQNISRKIGLYRERAFLSNAQASWLFTILTSFEKATTNRPSKTRTSARPSRITPPRSSSEDTSNLPSYEKLSPVSTASSGLRRRCLRLSTSPKHWSPIAAFKLVLTGSPERPVPIRFLNQRNPR